MRAWRPILHVLLLCAALSAAPVAAGEPDKVTAQQVNDAVRRGIQAVRHNLRLARQWGNVGYSAIGVMALVNAGVSPDDAVVADAIKIVVNNAETAALDRYARAYNAGVVNMMLAMLKNPKYEKLARSMTQRLQSYQAPGGGWGDTSFVDFSRTQFALLGLKAAEEMGISVPARVYTSAKHFVDTGRNADGSWGYQPRSGSGYGSMTAAGVGSLFIANEQVAKNSNICGQPIADQGLKAGLKWLGEHFTVRGNPMAGAYHYYYLYALERIGVMTNQRFIGGHDWYREGAAFLVREQLPNGQWQANEPLATEFALLFLAKGRAPVVLQKLQHGDDWDPDPYDAKDLVQAASLELRTQMSCQYVDQSATARDLLAAPILYLQGHKRFAFTPDFRAALKDFIDQGGFVFASACCGSEEFDKSFRLEMKLLFPDAAFERLPENHEIFQNINDANAITMEGLNTGCRTAVIYAPHDLCCAWGECKGCTDKQALRRDATALGINMINYALGFKDLRDKLSDDPSQAEKTEANVSRGSLIIGQLYHDGDWNPDPSSIGNLTRTMKVQFGIKGDVAKRRVVLGADDPCEYPLLYLTGHRKFAFSTAQVEALRQYLDKGGFLLADPCCGKAEFDAAFRKLCQELFPNQALTAIPADHPIMQEPYRIEKVEYKPAVKLQFPAVGQTPQLEGITAKDGRLQVFYSRFNFGCELQGHACANCLGLKARDAYRIAVNAIQYALSH
jgi:hypothetical protein